MFDRLASAEEFAEIDDVRTRFLHAAARVLVEDAREVVERGLRPDDVADRADRTRRAFYARFDSKTDLLDELFDGFLHPDRNADIDETINAIDLMVAEEQGDLAASMRVAAEAHFISAIEAELHDLQMIAWSASGADESSAIRLQRLYSSFDDALSAAFERLMGHWGRRFREPFDASTVPLVFTALLDGLLIRRRFDPDRVPTTLFGDVIVALVPAITQTDGPAESVADPIAGIAAEAAARWRESQVIELRNARRGIVDAARSELDRAGRSGVDLERIATTAGFSQYAIGREFAGLDHIYCTAIDEYVASFVQGVETDLLDTTKTRLDVAHRHLERLIRFAISNRPLIRALVVAELTADEQADYSPSPSELIDRLGEPLGKAVQWASNSGEVTVDGNVRDDVNTITWDLLTAAARSGEGDSDALIATARVRLAAVAMPTIPG